MMWTQTVDKRRGHNQRTNDVDTTSGQRHDVDPTSGQTHDVDTTSGRRQAKEEGRVIWTPSREHGPPPRPVSHCPTGPWKPVPFATAPREGIVLRGWAGLCRMLNKTRRHEAGRTSSVFSDTVLKCLKLNYLWEYTGLWVT